MSKHTAGPWTAYTHKSGWMVKAPSAGYWNNRDVALVIEHMRLGDDAEADCHANAALISAAPDLLVACKAAAMALATTDTESREAHVYCQIMAAIAKAEGGEA